jgi:glycine cleavage system H protein
LYPDDLKYTTEHEWVREPGEHEGSVRIGITHYAQDALGDIVYVSLPELGESVTAGSTCGHSLPELGESVTAGSTCGELESTKSVSDVYAPVSGEVVARNDALDATPELVNNDPYGGGWLFEVVPSDRAELDALLDASTYEGSLEA